MQMEQRSWWRCLHLKNNFYSLDLNNNNNNNPVNFLWPLLYYKHFLFKRFLSLHSEILPQLKLFLNVLSVSVCDMQCEHMHVCVCTHCMCITNPCSVMVLGHVLPCNCFEERIPETCHCLHTSSPTQKCLWGSFVALPLSPLHSP